MTRYVALIPSAAPLAGRCPACDAVMDESGCRVGDHLMVKPDARIRTGIGQIVECFCDGVPTARIVECPACPA